MMAFFKVVVSLKSNSATSASIDTALVFTPFFKESFAT